MNRHPPAVMKIVHLITGLSTGGAETMLLRLLSTMDRDQVQNKVVSLTGLGPIAQRINEIGIPTYGLGLSKSAPNPVALIKLWRLLRSERPDVLQTWLYHADLVGTVLGRLGGVSRIAWNIRCARTDARYVAGINGLVVKLLAKLSSYPDVVVVNSRAGREIHASLGYRPRQWALIPNGFDTAMFKPDPSARQALLDALSLAPSSLLIGLVARFDPLKDHANFIAAAGILSRRIAAARFVLVGAGMDAGNAELTALIARHGIGDRVHLLGERRDTPMLTAGFDIASCASNGEAFPNVVGEAMACGVPCVVTDVGDTAILLGDAGLVVPPRDADALAAGWANLAGRSADERRALGDAGRQRILQHYTIARAAARYQALYEGLRLAR